MPESTVTDQVRTLLGRACVTDRDQVEYIMAGLVPIFQQARDEAVAAHPDERWQRHVEPEAAEPDVAVQQCWMCEGTGTDHSSSKMPACTTCQGKGWLPITVRRPFISGKDDVAAPSQPEPRTVHCNRCGGTGVFRTPNMRGPCDKCKGAGRVPAQEGGS